MIADKTIDKGPPLGKAKRAEDHLPPAAVIVAGLGLAIPYSPHDLIVGWI